MKLLGGCSRKRFEGQCLSLGAVETCNDDDERVAANSCTVTGARTVVVGGTTEVDAMNDAFEVVALARA
jgi:hypothetical protein